MRLVPDWLAQRAALSPEKAALVVGGEAWSFAELAYRSAATAADLRQHGVVEGDHVALLAPNGLDYARATFAVMQAGAVLVPLNTRLTTAELQWQLADCGSHWLIDGTGFAPPGGVSRFDLAG